jgi:phage-related minor tail protein
MTSGTEIGAIEVRVGADIGDLTANLGQASRSLKDTTDSMSTDLSTLGDQASGVFDGLSSGLARSATRGLFSVRGMVDGIITEMSRLAIRSFVTKPLESAIGQIFSGLSFGGGRASGGPVAGGTAYLVGEQGPELFVPRQSGTILPQGRSGAVTVNIYAQDAPSVIRSETQIAAMLARANRRGMRNL